MSETDTTAGTQTLMGVAAVAAYLDVKESWVYDNHRRLGVPFFRLGNQLRARRADLDKWLSSQRAT